MLCLLNRCRGNTGYDLVTYTLTVSNGGTGPNGAPLVVNEFLPAGFNVTTALSADKSLVTSGSTVTVTLTASATGRRWHGHCRRLDRHRHVGRIRRVQCSLPADCHGQQWHRHL